MTRRFMNSAAEAGKHGHPRPLLPGRETGGGFSGTSGASLLSFCACPSLRWRVTSAGQEVVLMLSVGHMPNLAPADVLASPPQCRTTLGLLGENTIATTEKGPNRDGHESIYNLGRYPEPFLL